MTTPRVIWINGAFGVGKTTVARLIAARDPDVLFFDPEEVGFFLWKVIPPHLRAPHDFQDDAIWRDLVAVVAERLLKHHRRSLVCPMTLINPEYFDEIIGALRTAGIRVDHYMLVASRDTLMKRLRDRGTEPDGFEWCMQRNDAHAAASTSPKFREHIDTEGETPERVAEEILAANS